MLAVELDGRHAATGQRIRCPLDECWRCGQRRLGMARCISAMRSSFALASSNASSKMLSNAICLHTPCIRYACNAPSLLSPTRLGQGCSQGDAIASADAARHPLNWGAWSRFTPRASVQQPRCSWSRLRSATPECVASWSSNSSPVSFIGLLFSTPALFRLARGQLQRPGIVMTDDSMLVRGVFRTLSMPWATVRKVAAERPEGRSLLWRVQGART